MANKTFISIDDLLGNNAFASASRIFQAGAIDNTDLFAAGVIPSSAISGTIDVSDGGTGLSTTPTNGQLLIGNGTGYTLAILTDGTGINISEGVGSINIDLNINGLATTAITAADEVPFYDTTGTANGKITLANFEAALTLDNVGGTLGISKGGTGQITQTAAFDALSPLTTAGDVLYHNGTDNIRLATSNTSAFSTNSSGTPNWASGTTANRILRTDGTNISFAQVALTTDVAGILPVVNGGTGTSTTLTTGSVVFAGSSGIYDQDNANLFWDNTNNRLGIGINAGLSGAIHILEGTSGNNVAIFSTTVSGAYSPVKRTIKQLRILTVNNTPVNLSVLTTVTDTVYFVRAYTTAVESTSMNHDSAIYTDFSRYKNDNGTLTVSQLTNQQDEDDPAWETNLIVSGTTITLEITGDGTETVEWHTTIEIEEVKFS